jgi:hypothetical protein
MSLFVNKDGKVLLQVAATKEPGDSILCYGLLAGTQIVVTDSKTTAGGNLYYQFDSAATKGVTIRSFAPGNLWVLAEGEPTVKEAVVITKSSLGSLVERQDTDGELIGFSLEASCPLDDEEGMTRLKEIATINDLTKAGSK